MSTKRTDGRLQKSFTVGGKRYYVYGRNNKELAEKEKQKREEIEKNIEIREDPTIAQYYEKWSQRRENSIKEATLRGQIKVFNIIANIFIPSVNRRFGDIKINNIKIDDLRYVQEVLKENRRARTVNDYMGHLACCLADAHKEHLLKDDFNPCVLLKKIKVTEEQARDTFHRALTIKETEMFFNCPRCKRSSYYNVFKMAIATGMRAGEIGALKYSDIYDDAIHIERTVTRLKNGSYVIGVDAKTKAGKRIIPINKQIKDVINRQKQINIIKYNDVINLDDTLFKAPQGGLLMATPADREIKAICNECGVEPFTMHAFRATFATRAIEKGMNIKTIQELLGHTNFNLTMSLYGHCMDETKKKEMSDFNIAF